MTQNIHNSAPKLTPHDERRVAVAAGCDPRTVRTYLAGQPTRSTTAARIRAALHALGVERAPSDLTPVH